MIILGALTDVALGRILVHERTWFKHYKGQQTEMFA